jgi:hypothetical protein
MEKWIAPPVLNGNFSIGNVATPKLGLLGRRPRCYTGRQHPSSVVGSDFAAGYDTKIGFFTNVLQMVAQVANDETFFLRLFFLGSDRRLGTLPD